VTLVLIFSEVRTNGSLTWSQMCLGYEHEEFNCACGFQDMIIIEKMPLLH